METALISVNQFGLEQALDLMNLGFSDYLVPIRLTLNRLYDMARVDSVDFDASKVMLSNGEGAGVALIARRGDFCRLAAMSIRPEYRGRGMGQRFMDLLFDQARGRGEHKMVLEVITSNEPAVRLYRTAGFQTRRRLLSFELDHADGKADALEDTTIEAVAEVVATDGLPDLPWQASAETISQLGTSRAVRLGDAYAVVTNPEASAVVIQCLIVRTGERGRGLASNLLQALFARYGNRRWHVSAICPEEIGGCFESNGFNKGSISQLQMEMGL